MTVFLLEVNTTNRTLRWVRAGHEPAVLYEPDKGRFAQLNGTGMAMGVQEDFPYQTYFREGWQPGSIVVLGTDGINEARNSIGEMFGTHRLYDIIASHAHEGATVVLEKVFDEINAFQEGSAQEDDITLAVLRLL
jgi:sigma-B regulation protein RsbU (phosphoserine phosphatase)